MAIFDKSQGFTFVYTNFFELYKNQKQLESNKAQKLNDLFVVDRLNAFSQPMSVVEAEEKSILQKKETNDPFGQLKKNLEALSQAHAKLRFLIQEIDQITKKSQK